jgi:hypothetical protein
MVASIMTYKHRHRREDNLLSLKKHQTLEVKEMQMQRKVQASSGCDYAEEKRRKDPDQPKNHMNPPRLPPELLQHPGFSLSILFILQKLLDLVFSHEELPPICLLNSATPSRRMKVEID